MKRITYLCLLGFYFMSLDLNAQLVAPVRISNDTETFDSPEKIIPVDIDNDGDVDIVASSIFNGNIVFYENLDGQGAMDDPKIIASLGSFGADFVSVEDVDSDGVPDVLIVDGDEVIWVKNTIIKTASFSDLIYLPATGFSNGREAKMGDINGDGISDIVLVGHGLTVSWLAGIDGNGNFKPYEVLFEDGRYFIELADFDNDGDLDILSPTYEAGSFSLGWFENQDGNANFSAIQIIDPLIESPEDIQIVDLDMDNDLDVLVGVWTSIWNSYHYFWFENKLNDDGTWTKNVISDTNGFAPPTIFDVDADGDLDLITTQDKALRMYENLDGQENFEIGDTLAIYGGFSLSHADMNSDNILDIIGIYRTSTVNQELGLLYMGRADHSFENPIDYIGDADRCYTHTGFMEGRDINEDGIVELLTSHSLLDRFDWQAFDNSNLKFTNPKIIDNVEAADIDFADFDGDGDEDIVIAASATGNVQVLWYEKLDGEDNYGPAKELYSEHQSIKQVHAADIDGDGDMDIVLNKPGGDQAGIHWFENLDGQGNFSDFQTIHTGYFDFVEMEDVDLDGDLDLFGYDNGPDGFYWFENNNAIFSSPMLLFEMANVSSFLLQDMDGNGWKDLIYINEDKQLSLRKNNGGVGNYGDAINFSGMAATFGQTQLFLRDIDLDGDQDLLVSDMSVNNCFIYLFANFGIQEVFLNGSIIYALPNGTTRIAIDDFNGDQDMDIVINSNSNRIMHYIESFLDKSIILGKTYLDANQNTTHDTGEPLIFPQSVLLKPDALAAFPSGSGLFNFAVDDGNYEVSCNVSNAFEFTTPATQTVEVSGNSSPEISFGVSPLLEYMETLVTTTSAPARCGFQVPFWIDYQNTGTVVGNAVVSLELDSLVSFIHANPTPDSIIGHTVYWTHHNLAPTHSGQISLLLQMPGVEYLGEFLSFSSKSTITSLDGVHTGVKQTGYRVQVNCAYDPNDKLVEPSIPGHENYTLFGDSLEYTVRFQNTGTDTAFTVVIEDYLDRNLDYASLQILGASHPYEVTLDEPTGRLLFVFNNILLPDSTTNEVESHGYFKYRIQHKNGLPEMSYIQNYASIFFDFNPPIITNTVENILVSSYPLLVDVNQLSCSGNDDGSLSILYQLPFYESIQWSTGDTSLSITDLGQGTYDLSILYANGLQIDTSFLIIEPSPIELLMPTVETVNCYGVDDGSIEVVVEGGTPDYSYEWSNSVYTANQYNLAPGTYSLTVTDNNNCKDSLQVVIEAPDEIIVSIEVMPEFENSMNGTISVQATGGEAPFSYAWDFDPNETSNTLSGLASGDYTVSVTDANNCTHTQVITVDQITNTKDLGQTVDFLVSPNPSHGNIVASFHFLTQKRWELKLSNSIGQIVQTLQSPPGGNTGEQVHFTLKPGIYQLALLVEGKFVQSEILIVN